MRWLVSKYLSVPESQHGLSGQGPLQMPMFLIGRLDAGRVAVVNVPNHRTFAGLVPGTNYIEHLLSWLGQSRQLLPPA